MARNVTRGLLLVGLIALATGVAEARTYEIDYATYDVKLTDQKGVTSEVTEFGFYTGANVLNARRGDAYVEIPFRKIRRVEIGKYIPSKGHYPCTVTSRKNKTFQVQIERVEGRRFLGGDTDVGKMRIRLGQIQRLDLIRLSRTEDMD